MNLKALKSLTFCPKDEWYIFVEYSYIFFIQCKSITIN